MIVEEKAREEKRIAGCGDILSALRLRSNRRSDRRISVTSDTTAQIKTKEKEGLTGRWKTPNQGQTIKTKLIDPENAVCCTCSPLSSATTLAHYPV
ncbi:hypothetical protein ACNKHM_16510 [Shigella sonnei]